MLSPLLERASVTQLSFGAACVLYCALFACLYRPLGRGVDLVKAAKRRSWVLTGASSLIVTLVSLPYLGDLLASGLDVARVGRRPVLSEVGIGSFLAYLLWCV